MSVLRQCEELVSWQRMHALNIEIRKATESGLDDGGSEFRDEIRNAADAAERHIAEGYGRHNPRVFANFLDFARAAGRDTRLLLRKGLARGYFSTDQCDRLDSLAVQGLRSVVNFQRFLRSPAAKRIGRYQRPYTVRIPKSANDPNGSSSS
jgi:four helix bundle protein